MAALTVQRVTTEALSRLAATLESLELGPSAGSIAVDRDRLAGVIRSYLIPRAIDTDTPMTVVIAGPTGSGKSTVVNSLSDTDASRTGALRPTTRTPTVLAAPIHAATYEVIGGIKCDVVSVDAPIFENVVLVDAPDIDSTSTRHRVMAEMLIDTADLVVFVTSALRYADEVPWQVLRRAEARGVPVIHVLNRVGSASVGSTVDFRSRLSEAGMGDDLIVIPEHHLAEGAQRVPSVAVQALLERLVEAADRHEAMAGNVYRRVLSATLTQVIEMTDMIVTGHEQIDLLESEMSDHLTRRVPDVSLVGATEGFLPSPPAGSSRWAMRRWKKRVGGGGPEVASARSSVIERMVTIVGADIRGWLVEESSTLRELAIEPTVVIDGVTPAVRSAVEGWVDYVARIDVEIEESDVWLSEAALIDAAIRNELTQAVQTLFGDSGPIVVERARRELTGRLEVVYQLTARVAADILRHGRGDRDEADLRAAVGAVTATLAPIHA